MKLAPKQARFVEEYLIDLNATQAAIRAGYSPKTAEQQGSRLLGNAKVSVAIHAARAAREERTQITQDWVLSRLVENVERSMQAEPVRDAEGEPTGEYTYQGAVANKALELIGKHLGMFKDETRHTGEVRFVLDIPRPEPAPPTLTLLAMGDDAD
jgi:phage terminase small subunit